MVHVTSYLNFSAEIRSLPSRNSVNVRKIFRGVSTPALQTGRGNVPTAEHFSRNTVISHRRRDCFHPPGESGLATVHDTENLTFSEEFRGCSARNDADFPRGCRGTSARAGADLPHRQARIFRADSVGKWREPEGELRAQQR